MILRRTAAILILLALVAGIVGIILHGDKANPTTDTLQVVAAENFWGDIAQQLGGPYVHVTSVITNPNADPHLYESNARDAANVTAANVVIVNGLGYDDFMNKLLGATNRPTQTVLSAQSILGATGGTNPHLWYDIPRVSEVAARIEAAYAAKDPTHRAQYQHNLLVFNQSLQPLLQIISNIQQKYVGTPVAYTEPVPGYLLNATGLDVLTPTSFAKSIEDGTDPTPADANAMDALMTNRSVKLLVYNSQAISPVTEKVKDLARQNNIPIVGMTETMPASTSTYQSWQMSQLQKLENALKSAD